MPFSGACSTDEKLPISVSYTTAAGRPAQVHGDTQIEVSSLSGTASFERTGSHSGFIVSGDQPEDVSVLVSADADLGEGIVLVQDAGLVSVTGAQASVIGVSLGAPVPK